jgi:methanogenic corrinoid protein MtbC1
VSERETRTSGLRERDAPHGVLAAAYLASLLEGERRQASELVLDAVEDGVSVKEIYLHVFQPCQREIGRLWQRNEVTVAEEHYVTAATQLIMSQLYPRIFSAETTGRRLVATCVGGELHEIGVRMVADFFEMEGWDTYYLGANTPTGSILETLESRQPDLLGISATITFNLDEVIDLVKEVRSAENGDGLPILVGGRPFLKTEGLWERVGADGYAPDAQEAIRKAEELLK